MKDYGVPSAAADAVIEAVHPSHDDGGPCDGCAFRLGTEANASVHTMQLARMCVEGITPFQCHEHQHVCRGWMAAVNLLGAPESEHERRWMQVNAMGAELWAQAIAFGVEADRAAKAGER